MLIEPSDLTMIEQISSFIKQNGITGIAVAAFMLWLKYSKRLPLSEKQIMKKQQKESDARK